MKYYLNKSIFFKYAVFALLIIRAFFNAVIPLMDKTEARYSEIARIMSETNNWITPQIDYGVPFWAKPPLSTWLSALSFSAFGVTEFTARLPSLLLSIALLFLTGKYATRKNLPFYLPAFILLTLPEFFLHAGVVSTDTALTFCVSLVMLSFWEAMQANGKWYWKYLIFIGLGFGLLAKGPIIGILTVPPLILWLIINKKWTLFFNRIPLVSGTLIVLLIAAPWYYLAEKETEGFIDYFIVGEHFKRFFDSSWKGDKYGFPKSQVLGMIWVFLFLFTLPWLQALLVKLWPNKKNILQDKWVVFLLLWLLWTPLFFTVSKSLIHPYIMPVMIPIALLVVSLWQNIKQKKGLIIGSTVLPLLTVVVFIYSSYHNYIQQYANTDKYLIESLNEQYKIYHLKNKSYSSQFYSKGKIEILPQKKLLYLKPTSAVIITHKDYQKLNDTIKNQLTLFQKNRKKGVYHTKQ
ncbi:glycosyltransferase family 39 protein [Flavobacteriaceae bacterium]|nr:glycosyltransferase family 39 protein [Flavobacteriaceae bacterium]MDA9887083.1 glycosyltransferase family 39 protein [Flavobacteriaceae bacterium]MDB4113205.1 glycosyltransferase family 39 protein [Flavobacteriaceae bacterium]MDB4187708.1 glycosyltransferase family 39 protein [Flavobacteriaceae bacterium]MDB9821362.1 glycosyltransferase family 39 protein [Flavobacteriaceae bacterium]